MVDDSSESITKTSKAVQILKSIGAYEDAAKAKECINVRRGKGKMRNRRYVNRKGPLVIYGNDNGIAKAFRNLPGVDTAPVTALNLLQVSSRTPLAAFHALQLDNASASHDAGSGVIILLSRQCSMHFNLMSPLDAGLLQHSQSCNIDNLQSSTPNATPEQ